MGARTLRKRVIALVALLGIVLLSAGIMAIAEEEQHSVTVNTDDNFNWKVTGYIEFTYDDPWGNPGTISTASGTITVNPGDRVKIVVDSLNEGNIWFGSDGWLDITGLPVEAIYVNGELVASDTVIISANMHYDVSSVVSTLKLEVTPKQGEEYGWAQLVVDGQTLINQWNYSGYIIVYNIAPSQSASLNFNIGGQYLSGVAAGVEWDGNTIGVSEFPLPHLVFG